MDEVITTERQEKTGFNNPYADTTVDGIMLSFRAHKGDWELVKSTRPATATISTTLGLLWKGLVNAMLRLDIKDVTKSTDYERLVAGLHIISHTEWLEYQYLKRGRPTDSSAGGPRNAETGSRDDRPGTPRPHQPTAAVAEQLPNVPRRGRTKRGRAAGEAHVAGQAGDGV